ncbi:MAG: ArsC family reductase [Sulfuricella sp.]
MKLYGIPNCNSVKKARTWLAEQGIDLPFHDFKKQGVSEELLMSWLKETGRDKLVNRQGTTWRQLPDDAKAAVGDDAGAIRLMLEKPSVIKRPVLEKDGKITLGFDEAVYQSLFGIK